MDEKVKVSVLGFSFNQTRSGTYGLVLSEEDGPRRLMVVVGTPEAQSIAFELQQSKPPRPLSHDLFKSLIQQFKITVLEVLIYKYEDGIYFSKIFLRQKEEIVELESRTSDAVAIALRVKAPIFTFESIMSNQGVVFDERDQNKNSEPSAEDELDLSLDYSLLNKDELETMLQDAIEGEDYELASLLRDELRKKD